MQEHALFLLGKEWYGGQVWPAPLGHASVNDFEAVPIAATAIEYEDL